MTADTAGAVSPPSFPTCRLGCPRCRSRAVWVGWAKTAPTCPHCGLDLSRHGWAAAVWINSWFTAIVLVTWIVTGLWVWGLGDGRKVQGGAIILAVVTPPLLYPIAKGVMLRALYALDPPQDEARSG